MATYFMYKMFIYDVLIDEWLINGDAFEKALSIIAIPIFAIMGFGFIILDIIGIPIYIVIRNIDANF